MTIVNTKAVQQGRYKPQWGRSVSNLLKAPPQRLVSLRFDEPQDLTIYMQANIGFPNPRDFPYPYNFQIGFGTGGTSNTTILRSAAVGSVYHVTAQQIDVDVLTDRANSNANRARAWCAVGRPIDQWVTASARSALSESPRFSLPMFARAVRLAGKDPAFSAGFFNQYDYTNTLISSRPNSDFVSGFVPLNNNAVEYTFQATTTAIDPYEITFEIFQ